MNKEQQTAEMATFIHGRRDKNGSEKTAKALFEAGYRKVPKGSFICSGSEANLDVEVCNNCEMQQADELFERDKEIERLQKENEVLKRVDNRVAFCKAYDQIRAENKRLKAENKQLQEQLNSANAGKVNCSGCEAVETNTVKEFAEKLKDICASKTTFEQDEEGNEYMVFGEVGKCDIDGLLKEYEK
jgi:hypothetical protein